MFNLLYSEYYFSPDNLARDFFLRRKMDVDGWIPVPLVATFHRVQALTQDLEYVIRVSRSQCSDCRLVLFAGRLVSFLRSQFFPLLQHKCYFSYHFSTGTTAWK